MSRLSTLLRQIACFALGALALAPTAQAQSRGQLLYNTHCLDCHSKEMHWREQRAASDWTGLMVQVQRWQGNAGLNWSDDDILAVTRYLNETVYLYPQTSDRRAGLNPLPRRTP